MVYLDLYRRIVNITNSGDSPLVDFSYYPQSLPLPFPAPTPSTLDTRYKTGQIYNKAVELFCVGLTDSKR